MVSKVLRNVLNKKCMVVYKKSYIVIVKDITYTNTFLVTEDDKRKIRLNKEAVNFIYYEHDKGTYKLGYCYPYNTFGTVKEFDESFLTIEIENTQNGKTYDNIIPIKQLLGIKLYNEDDDEYIDED